MIPEDVMKTARTAARQSVERPYNEGTMKRATDVIARAIMAERERAAQIADDEASNGCGCNPVALGERIADRIRNA